MTSLHQSFSGYDAAINEVLGAFFENSIESAQAIHPRYKLLWEELGRVTQNGGKRLRPKITLLSYEAFGGTDISAVIPIAAALEILHSSLLIHDDIIDRELSRRGELNVAGAYESTHYKILDDTSQRRHYSDSAALLGGDLLLASTFQIVDKCTLPIDRINSAKEVLHEIIFEVAGGQLLDSETILAEDSTMAERIARYKTASYSFIGPLLIGAKLAGADDSSSEILREFAVNIGTAYQLHDDLLGIFGDETETGKSTIGDLREGKRTYLIEQFLQSPPTKQRSQFLDSFGNAQLNDSDAQMLKSLLIQSGAKAKTEQHIENYVVQAHDALERLTIDDASRHNFELLIDVSVRRDR